MITEWFLSTFGAPICFVMLHAGMAIAWRLQVAKRRQARRRQDSSLVAVDSDYTEEWAGYPQTA